MGALLEVYWALNRILPSFTGFYWVLPSFSSYFGFSHQLAWIGASLGFYWVLNRILPSFSEVWPSFTGFYWVFTEFYQVLPSLNKFHRVISDFLANQAWIRALLGFYWALERIWLGFTEFYRALPSCFAFSYKIVRGFSDDSDPRPSCIDGIFPKKNEREREREKGHRPRRNCDAEFTIFGG